MSRIVEYMEEQQRRETFISVLQYLLDCDEIEDERAQGITRQIIGEGTLENLSPKQIYRYEQDVLHLVEVWCDGHCEGTIDIEDLENAYMRDTELGGRYCQLCMYDIENQD
ncbi:hypothetical protein [Marinobacter shengliensis]